MAGPYDAEIQALYAQYGKTPDLIDQEGMDYWSGQLAAGNDINSQFVNAATGVYQNGYASPYQSQNDAGLTNWIGGLDQGAIDYYGSLGVGSNDAWDALNPAIRAGIASGNIDMNTLTPAMRKAIPSNQALYGGGAPNYGQGGASSFAAPTLKGYEPNPYLAQMAGGLRDQFTGFMNDGLAANRGNAVANGNVGSSRQGIAEARTMTDAGKGFDSALTNMYYGDFNNSMNRNLQQYGMDQNFALGSRSADLGFLNSDRSYDLGKMGNETTRYGMGLQYDTQNRSLDQSGARLGMDMTAMNTLLPWDVLRSASAIYGNAAGNNVTGTTGGTTGGGAMGAVGGAGAGAQMYNGYYSPYKSFWG